MRKNFTEHEQAVFTGKPEKLMPQWQVKCSGIMCQCFWGLGEKLAWDLECFRYTVISDPKIRQSSLKSPNYLLCADLGYLIEENQWREIVHQCREKTWSVKILTFHLVKKKETPTFPDNGSHSITPPCALWITHTQRQSDWGYLFSHTHTIIPHNAL